MQVYYRLIQDFGGLPAGACITEDKFKGVYYLDKPLFEPINEFEIEDMIRYDDEKYCINLGVELLLFYTPLELELFLNKEEYAV